MTLRFSRLTPEYRWNERAKRYIAPDGRFVSQEAVRGALERVIDKSMERVDKMSKDLVAGDISLADWQTQMAGEIKTLHLAAAAAARGGWAQMSQADFGYAGALIKKQYRFLQNFANEVASGKQKLNLALVRRARMYAQAGRGTNEQMRTRIMETSGFTEEQRVLGVADHCHGNSSGCIEQAAIGWLPIGQHRPIGDSICLSACHCHKEYRNALGEVSE